MVTSHRNGACAVYLPARFSSFFLIFLLSAFLFFLEAVYLQSTAAFQTTLWGVPVTTPWRVLRLRVEETASGFGG